MSELKNTRKENGLCEQCGTVLDRVGSCCIRCNNNNNKSKHNGSLKLHEEGKCVNCGNILDREGWFCKECMKKANAHARERNARRRANGKCVQCGVKIELGSYCQRCLDQRMDRYWNKKNGTK
jgi:predicted amidophosphoribosyltransferase